MKHSLGTPTLSSLDHWRGVILYGRNVATYKIALVSPRIAPQICGPTEQRYSTANRFAAVPWHLPGP